MRNAIPCILLTLFIGLKGFDRGAQEADLQRFDFEDATVMCATYETRQGTDASACKVIWVLPRPATTWSVPEGSPFTTHRGHTQ